MNALLVAWNLALLNLDLRSANSLCRIGLYTIKLRLGQDSSSFYNYCGDFMLNLGILSALLIPKNTLLDDLCVKPITIV